MAVIKCKVKSGMFPHEVGVLIQGVDRWYESMVDRDFVECDSDTGDCRMDVQIVGESERGVLVQLPRQVVVGGRRIWVRESEIQRAT